MAKKQEERDWSEIIAEVRAKAKSDIDELVEDIRPRVQALVDKVREANFHEEAEELLSKLKEMANDFSKSEDDGPAKSTTAAKPKEKSPPMYIEPDGTPRWRTGKWSEKYSATQLKKMKQR